MTLTYNAIETRYAGCRFRSRLEARWAVFFDHLGIEWQYESRPVKVSYRLALGNRTFLYLPDFWLPKLETWVEVKGSLDDDGLFKLLNAAAALSVNEGGGCHDAGGNDLVLLGSPECRPETGRYSRPWRLHMHKGGLYATPWDLDMPGTSCPDLWGGSAWEVAVDYGGDLADITSDCERTDLAGDLLAGHPEEDDGTTQAYRFIRGLQAARSARFEHGETPARPA